MATVYLADDLRHERKVALKVLKPELAAVVGAERFLAEIKTTANLQHPHVLPLFDSGEADGFLFYVMPYVEGESLRERLDREKQLPVDEAVQIAGEVAEALDYAHRRDVIHRDVKPENVLLLEGRALVADFGIALAVSAGGAARLTETGLSLGTPSYMSPEQATGDRVVDGRTDIYALGCLLYEMLTGQPPHTGSTAQAILASVLTQQPRPVTELRDTVPLRVARIAEKAIARLPADRFRNAGEVRDALAGRGEVDWDVGVGFRGRVAGGVRPGARFAPVHGALALALAVAAWGWLRPRAAPPTEVTRFTVPVPTGHAMSGGEEANLDVSRDGRLIAYVTEDRLHVHSLETGESRVLLGAEGGASPVFSPDGRWVVFSRDDRLYRIPTEGGPVLSIAGVTGTAFNASVSWHESGYLTYAPFGGSTGIWRVHEDGGEPERLPVELAEGATQIAWPQLTRDGDLLIFSLVGPSGLWVDTRVVAHDLETGTTVTVAENAHYGRYVATGHVLYVDARGTLFAVPFDLSRAVPTGAAFPVEQGVRTASWAGGASSYAVSEAGTAVFVRGSNAVNHTLHWVDRSGRIGAQVGEAATSGAVRLSPDGTRLATWIYDVENADLWIVDAATGHRERLTTDPGWDWMGVWSPDGERIAHHGHAERSRHSLFVRPAVPGPPPEHLYESESEVWPSSWSADGRWLAFQESSPDDNRNLYAVEVDNPGDPVTVAASPADEAEGTFHPALPLIAYMVDDEIWISSFPDTDDARQVTSSGGESPRWSKEGDELFYWRGDTLFAQPVGGGGWPEGAPERLFATTGPSDYYDEVFYDVAPGAQRFLIQFANPEAPAREIDVVLNWFEVLGERDGS